MSKSADSQIEQQQEAERLRTLRDNPEVKALAERLVQRLIDEAEIDTGGAEDVLSSLRLALHRACLSLAICERDRDAQIVAGELRMLIEMKGSLYWNTSGSHKNGGFWVVNDAFCGGDTRYVDDPLPAIAELHGLWKKKEHKRINGVQQRIDDCYRYLGCEPPERGSEIILAEMREAG